MQSSKQKPTSHIWQQYTDCFRAWSTQHVLSGVSIFQVGFQFSKKMPFSLPWNCVVRCLSPRHNPHLRSTRILRKHTFN